MKAVAILPGAGEARVAGQSWRIAPLDAGGLRLDDGPGLRPLRFGERAALTRAAGTAEEPAAELALAVLALATTDGPAHPAAAAVALHLAGAGDSDLGFAVAQSLLARQLGWSAADVAAAPAAEVDALAGQWQTAVQTGSDGWTRLVFAAPDAAAGDDPEAVALALAENLLQRARAGIDPDSLPPVTAARSAGRGAADLPRAAAGQAGPAAVVSDITGGGGDTVQDDAAAAPEMPRAAQDNAAPDRAGDRAAQAAGPGAAASGPRAALPDGSPLAPARAGTRDQARAQAGDEIMSGGPATDRVAANPTPHPAPRAAGAEAGRVSAAPAAAARADHPARDIWARRPLAETPRPAGGAQLAAPDGDGAQLRPFAGWFDDAPVPSGFGGTEPRAAAPWVWGATPGREAPAPDLPQAAPLVTGEDPATALAEALHLACDLRGIAP